jgi:outer membrane protein assembly factor BamD (BamD/ComL family)
LAYKQFSIGRYYQKTGNEQSANLYYRMVLRNWPDSSAAKMAGEKINQELEIEKQNDK